MHQQRQLQWQRSFCWWDAGIGLHVHLRNGFHWNNVQCVRTELPGIPLMHRDSLYEQRELQQQGFIG